jgi:hypothetical protein
LSEAIRADSTPGVRSYGAPGRRAVRAAACAALALVAAVALAQAASADDVTVVATVTPLNPTEGDTVSINITITSLVNQTLQNIVLSIQQGTQIAASRPGLNIPPYGNWSSVVTFTAQVPNVVNRNAGLTLQVQTVVGAPLGKADFPAFFVRPKPAQEAPLPVIPIALAAAGGVGAVLFLMQRNKKKAETARLAAEAAAKKDLEKRAAAEAARELAATQKVHGKYPAEYFYRRRLRLANLVPSSMTSAGLPVLQPKKIEEKKVVYSCQRCGTHKESFDAPCPRCSVQDAIEATRAEVKKHKTGADLGDVGDLLQQAEFQLSYSSYGEAQVLVDQAKTLFNEILTGAERTVQVKKIETITAADRKATVLDIGIMTEHTAVDQQAEEQEHEAREAYAQAASQCPTCGHAMYGDLCAYCHFDDYVRLTKEAIDAAAKAGAETVEPRDLLERAGKLREEDNKSTASRYLNRARYLAVAHAQTHLAGKAEGMIDYARTLMLVGEEDGLTADFAAAEATIAQADERRSAGDAGAAVDLAARAESEIHAALGDLTRRVAIKRIDEAAAQIDEAQGKGIPVAAPEAKLKEARAAFDAGDHEKARDLSGAVNNLVRDAAKGKNVCPKCGKPVQPTWERCPYCTTQLRG